jgi:predicted ATPase
MLKKLRLIDFKSFADASVELAPLTLFVGANASGKSNLFDALRFLQAAVSGMTLDDVLNGDERGHWPGIRGGAAEAARAGKSLFTIESTWELVHVDEENFDSVPLPMTVEHEIRCHTRPAIRLDAERLCSGAGEELFRTDSVQNDHISTSWPSRLADSSQAQRKVMAGPADWSMTSVWKALDLPREVSLVPPEFAAHVRGLDIELTQMRFLDLQPASMRGYGRSGADLGENGKNLSGVLHDLCSDQAQKQTFVDWLAELCAPELADIDFIRVEELGDVMAVLVEKDGTRISVRSLSDGTLRFLGTLVALFSARPHTIFVIEEIAEGLHPARIGVLVEWLQSLHRDKGIQLIATTHSPTVLRWLHEETLSDTILCARVPEHEGTVMRRLGDLPRFLEIVRDVGIEEMFTTRWLEMAL